MKISTLLKVVFGIVVAAAGFLLWLRVIDELDPETDENDGEEHMEIDPDLVDARPGDVLLFNRAKGLNRLITWFTTSRFYHVGIYIGDNRIVEARPRGVVIRDLTGPDGDKRFEIIPAENVGGREAALRAAKWGLEQLGDGYDPLNVASIILERTLDGVQVNASLSENWICSEFVVTAFEKAGVKLFPDIRTSVVVPADFEKFLPRAAADS